MLLIVNVHLSKYNVRRQFDVAKDSFSDSAALEPHMHTVARFLVFGKIDDFRGSVRSSLCRSGQRHLFGAGASRRHGPPENV